MDMIGTVAVGGDIYRVLGQTWMGCTVTGNAVNLGAHLWEGGRVSAVGTEGKASAGVTAPDGREFRSVSATYVISGRVVVIEGEMALAHDDEATPFRMMVQYVRTEPETRSYEELLGGMDDEIDHDWLGDDGHPLADGPNQ